MDISTAAAPRSDQINADDLIGGPQLVTITEVRKGNDEQPVEIVTAEFGPRRPYKPGKSMIRVLPPKNTAGLARLSVRCFRREPRPPART